MSLEKHYRSKELGILWGLSHDTITRLFSEEPGVMKLDNLGTGRKKRVTMSIPESVAIRVRDRLSHKPFESDLAGVNPLGIEFLGHGDAGVAKKLRHVIKGKAA